MELDASIRKFGMLSIYNGLLSYPDEIRRRVEMVDELALWDVPIPAGKVLNPADRFILEQDGQDPEGSLAWPVPGAPSELTANELRERMMFSGGEQFRDWLYALNHTDEGEIFGGLANDLAEGMIEVYENGEVDFEYGLEAKELLIMGILDGREDYPWDASEAEALVWIENRLKEMEAEGVAGG